MPLCLAWTRWFKAVPDIELVGYLTSADRMIETVDEMTPDVVVTDMSMKGAKPLDVVKSLVASHENVRVLVYSGLSEREVLEQVHDCGASGFVGKIEEPQKVLQAIRNIANGKRWFADDPLSFRSAS